MSGSAYVDAALKEQSVLKAAFREKQRLRAVAMREEGLPILTIAHRLGVNEGTARGLLGLSNGGRTKIGRTKKKRRSR